jgi:recombination protein RecA
LIQHLIANTSGYGSPFLEDGGNKIQYQSDVKLRCKGIKPWEEGKARIGQDVTWEVLWAANGPPGAKCISKLRYGIGIDEAAEMVDIGVDLGLIDKGGSWFTLDYLNNTTKDWAKKMVGTKVQGLEKLNKLMASDEKLSEELYAQIRYML